MGSRSISEEMSGLLTTLPPVEFCCVYGSTLHPNNHDETRMIDSIIGVGDPVKWHSENLKLNPDHYASFVPYLGGAKLVTHVANRIGVGVHFNPFVSWNDRTFKYGVVRMHDLNQDILHWEKLYFSGRLQKPVKILVDKLDIEKMNSINLRAATSAALLHLPCSVTEEDLYAKICSLSYMGDIRMLFAEDRHKAGKTLSARKWKSVFSPEGYLDIGKTLARIHRGGIHPEIRAEVWEFLLGCYEPHSTYDERAEIWESRRVKYARWKELCHQMFPLIGSGRYVTAPIITESGDPTNDPLVLQELGVMDASNPDASGLPFGPIKGMEKETDKIIIQWKLTLHQIGLDVRRTDMTMVFYQSQENLVKLSDILAVYA